MSRTATISEPHALQFGNAVAKNRRTKITVETERIVSINDRGPIEIAQCGLCRVPTIWVTPDSAAVIVGVTSRTIYRWVENQLVHYVETPTGLLLICLNSLPKQRQEGARSETSATNE
jgi:hypothetical protein